MPYRGSKSTTQRRDRERDRGGKGGGSGEGGGKNEGFGRKWAGVKQTVKTDEYYAKKRKKKSAARIKKGAEVLKMMASRRKMPETNPFLKRKY